MKESDFYKLSSERAAKFIIEELSDMSRGELMGVVGNAVQVALGNREENTAKTLIRQILINKSCEGRPTT